MTWRTPKTDWVGIRQANNVYSGDRFNCTDYNRIRENVLYLIDLVNLLYNYTDTTHTQISTPKNYYHYLYAEDMNALTHTITAINRHTINTNGTQNANITFYPNGRTMTAEQLNHIERATLYLYELLTNQFESRRNLKFNFGDVGGL